MKNIVLITLAAFLSWLNVNNASAQAPVITLNTAAVADSASFENELLTGNLPVTSLKPKDFTTTQSTQLHFSAVVMVEENGLRKNTSSLVFTTASFKITKRNVITGVVTTVVNSSYGVFNQTSSPVIVAKDSTGVILTAVNNRPVVGTNITAGAAMIEILDQVIPLSANPAATFPKFTLLPGERYEILFTFVGSATVNGTNVPFSFTDQPATVMVLPNISFDPANPPSSTATFLVQGVMHPNYSLEVCNDLVSAVWTPVLVVNTVSTGPNSSRITTSWPLTSTEQKCFVRIRYPVRTTTP